MRTALRQRTSDRFLAILVGLPVHEPDPAIVGSYERSAFGHGWRDYDRDGEDARAEVLIAWHRPGRRGHPLGNQHPLVVLEDRVIAGRWRCRFTRDWVTQAGDLDIDHLVPLKEAWISGAHAWTRDRRQLYANGQGIRSRRRSWLIPVTASLNRQKGARRPDEWMPPLERYHLNYAAAWVETKRYWKLGVTVAEGVALAAALHKVEV